MTIYFDASQNKEVGSCNQMQKYDNNYCSQTISLLVKGIAWHFALVEDLEVVNC